MLKNFELLLDLLDIEDKENYLLVAKEIDKNKYKNIKTYHKYGFIFELYSDFLLNKISLEEFVAIGDITGKIDISQAIGDLNTFLSENRELKNTLFVISYLDMKWKFSEKEIKEFEDKILSLDSKLMLV